jgi:hypothetical protein
MGMQQDQKKCSNITPSWFTGRWRDWHRGHGCCQDDGKDRSNAAVIEIEQHKQHAASGYLTDAELCFLRASTSSGNDLLVRALDELKARRAAEEPEPKSEPEHSCGQCGYSGAEDDFHACPGLPGENIF